MQERRFVTSRTRGRRAWGRALESHVSLRGILEWLGLLAALIVISGGLGEAMAPANHALLCMTAVVVAGIRQGFAYAILISLASVALMAFFHWEPRYSFHTERAEDWVTLICFGLASFLTGQLAGRFRNQLRETTMVAEHNERLYEASRLLAGTFQHEDLIRVVRSAVGGISEGDAVLLLPDAQGRLAPAHPWSGELSAADREIGEHCYTTLQASDPSASQAWHFLPLPGEHGALGILGVHRESGVPFLGTEQQRLLSALSHSAGVALERCRLSEEMRSAQMLVEAEKLRAALLSSVSHDLRTPLASIIGATSTLNELGDSVPPAQQRELLSMVLKEAERLDRFVGNLLDMTRIEYGKLQPQAGWCDLRDVLAGVVRGLHLVLANQPLKVSIDADFPLLFIDAVLLERVLENLVDNAVKHSGVELPVQVSASVSGSEAVIRVIDLGHGLSIGDRSTVQTLVHRARDADRRSAGSGLGLAICRGFVDALGGTLQLLDGPGRRGLCAEIRLPRGDALATLEDQP